MKKRSTTIRVPFEFKEFLKEERRSKKSFLTDGEICGELPTEIKKLRKMARF